jgi:hypothetical protein
LTRRRGSGGAASRAPHARLGDPLPRPGERQSVRDERDAEAQEPEVPAQRPAEIVARVTDAEDLMVDQPRSGGGVRIGAVEDQMLTSRGGKCEGFVVEFEQAPTSGG